MNDYNLYCGDEADALEEGQWGDEADRDWAIEHDEDWDEDYDSDYEDDYIDYWN